MDYQADTGKWSHVLHGNGYQNCTIGNGAIRKR